MRRLLFFLIPWIIILQCPIWIPPVLSAPLVTIQGPKPTDPAAKVNADNSLSVSDASGSGATWTLLKAGFLQTRFVYGADGLSAGWTAPKVVTCDSTNVLQNVTGFNRLGLLLTISFEDSVGAAMFAFQWRGAGNSPSSDSTNTYIGLSRNIVSGLPSDTLGSFNGMALLSRVGGAARSPWGSSLIDTVALYPGEVRVLLTVNNQGNNVIVPVKTSDGNWFSPPYFGLRWRIMNTYYKANVAAEAGSYEAIGGAGRTYGQAPVPNTGGICETCGGVPGTNPVSWGRWVIIGADLIGWRE